ncbi:hypothetical protein ACFLT0_00045 [Chloroflexota bacterium]
MNFTEKLFSDKLEYDANLLIGKNMSQESATSALVVVQQMLEQLEAFDTESLEALLRPLAAELGLKTGQLFGTLRIATTGRTAAPPLFQTMAVPGKQRSLGRIGAVLDRLHRLPK